MSQSPPLAVVVHGAEGRMGRLVTTLIEASPDCRLVGLVTEPGRLWKRYLRNNPAFMIRVVMHRPYVRGRQGSR